jgi:hypothetical protein
MIPRYEEELSMLNKQLIMGVPPVSGLDWLGLQMLHLLLEQKACG